MTREDRVVRAIAEELARWILSSVLGACTSFWAMLLLVLFSSGLLEQSARGIVRVFLLSSVLGSLFWYLVLVRRLRRDAGDSASGSSGVR